MIWACRVRSSAFRSLFASCSLFFIMASRRSAMVLTCFVRFRSSTTSVSVILASSVPSARTAVTSSSLSIGSRTRAAVAFMDLALITMAKITMSTSAIAVTNVVSLRRILICAVEVISSAIYSFSMLSTRAATSLTSASTASLSTTGTSSAILSRI